MVMQIKRTLTPDNPPNGLQEGQLAAEIATVPPKLWIGVPASINPSLRLLLNPEGAGGGGGIADVTTVGQFVREMGAWVPFTAGTVLGLTLGTVAPPSNPVDGHIWTNKCGQLFVWRPATADPGSQPNWVQLR